MTIRTRASAFLLAAILLLSPSARARGDGATPAPETPYRGDGSKYTYSMTDERDRKWEEDIVAFADFYLNYLHGHPRLTDRTIPVQELRYASGKLDSQSRGQNNTNFLDAALRERFIAEVNDLIRSIPALSDREIAISLQRIVASLYDAHSLVGFRWTAFWASSPVPCIRKPAWCTASCSRGRNTNLCSCRG